MKKIFQILAVIVAFLCATLPNSANAASDDAPYTGITPAKSSMKLIPGQTYTGSFQVTNPGEVEFNYVINVTPYKVYNQDYSKKDFSTYDSHTLIKDWVTLSSTEGYLAPHTASEPIFYTINVPNDIEVCGQYAAIHATPISKTDGDNTGVLNITGPAMLLYAEIDNCSTNLDGNVRIIENKIPTFLLAPPLTTTSLVENNGNVHVDAKYTLQVYSFFTGEEVYSNEENPATAIIMPETNRFKAQTWENTPILGIYRVRQTIKVYDQESVEEKIVIICPLWLIVLVLFAIIMTILWLRSRAKNRAKKTS